MKTALLYATAFAALTASASAADLPSPYGAPASPVFAWTGAYVGANLGYAASDGRTDFGYSYLPGNGTGNFSDFFGNAADNAGGSGFAGPANVNGLNAVQSALLTGIIRSSLGSSWRSGFAGGGQLGYNWQTGAFVYGAEVDLSWLGAGETSGFLAALPGAPPLYVNQGWAKTSLDWLATARLRAGYAVDRLLMFATAGLAFGGASASSGSVGTDGFVVDTFAGSSSATRVGWTAGGGAEYALTDHWIGRAEALYYDLGAVNYAVAAQNAETIAEGLSVTAHHRFDGALARVGLSYKF